MVVGVLWLFTNWNLSISSCHSCLLTVPAEFEKVPEKPPWCWFPSSQSNQGCRSAGCWFERYLTHLDLSSFFILSHLKERAQCESVLTSCYRKEWSLLCVGAGERQTADPHHLQEPPPGVEQSLYTVSLTLFSNLCNTMYVEPQVVCCMTTHWDMQFSHFWGWFVSI